ncbi:MBL fold metallo-hydrolase [Pseudonocardia xinjiangensis]|uniref:MBL fold metallo-hydrolase n=1 Tax=Pseudonocardia xinjiangensis TaxID=75289 RepID=A0ABX1RF07_9PSEU|nr:MBL fold metallo-hydrolase [Pseudonocardia xinjiangensis]NMH77798.1 MBL fold metallo-hydrolase [Pseudonocardia xinjiangensis]
MDITKEKKSMDGSVQTLDLDGLKVHIYTPPDESFLVNSTILELADRLIVVDGQIFQRFAREVGDVIDGLGKPVDRFVLTHNHPDHYSGFQHLTERFPGVQLATTASVRDYLVRLGQQVLDIRRAMFGDEIASRIVIPDAVIVPGELVISGVRFLFQEFHDTEAEFTLTITLPDHGVALVADLLAGKHNHLFTVQPQFDRWIAALGKIRNDVARFGLTTLIVGHGAPIDPEAVPANIAYLTTVKAAYDSSGTAEDFVAAVSASLPDRSPEGWLSFSSQMLYGHVAP